jgi:hypothetical protein
VRDFFCPFVEGEAARSTVLFWDAEDQVSRGDAVADGVEYASSNA